uniref:Uncharacterized protein n=1 Tax=Candidatus Kentrum sp. LFY TaxID=2126342 RepID=A0A450WXS3_9GAMM|nr:MAG: hypothetical protein BECKLFY1418C_GA0070996_110315 [Candidatus Kentron sp. LFY]
MHSGVRATATGHVRFQDRVSKYLIDLAPLPPVWDLSFSGVMEAFFMSLGKAKLLFCKI